MSISLKADPSGTSGTIQLAGNDTLVLSSTGVSASSGKTLEATGGPGNTPFFLRNKFINGNFDIWQRGTSFNLTTAGGNVYTADRWYAGAGGGAGAATVSRNAHVAGYGLPTYYYSHNQTAGGTYPFMSQKIENVRLLDGKTVTLSFAYSVTTPIQLQIIARQSFGTGGSPSAMVENTVGTVNLTTGGNSTVKMTFTMPSLVGKTIGTNGDSLSEIIFRFPDNTVFTFNVWSMQLEEGSVQTTFENRPIGLELSLCQRYFQTFAGDNINWSASYADPSNVMTTPINFPVVMRVTPTTNGTINYANKKVAQMNGTAIGTVTGIYASAFGPEGFFFVAVGSSLTTVQPVALYWNDTTQWATFSAEL